MPTLTIDGRQVTVPEGSTILDAAREAGVAIPTLCYREGLPPQTSCMVCVVRVNGSERLVPSCATLAGDGMEVESETQSVRAARRMALELLLSDHLGDCIAPCQLTCPAGMDIPRMIRRIVAGDLAGAAEIVKRDIPLPAVLGRICPELCENACRRGSLDQPVAIRLLKRWVGDEDLAAERPWRPKVGAPSGRRVAIVGAGPAGLAAAYYLRVAGHQVAVFDRREGPGGGMREIDPERLPPEVLQQEVDAILALGVELRPGVRIGEEIALDELRSDFDAVLLAVGEIDERAASDLGAEYGRRGLAADRRTHQSPLKGVFVAGSALSPSNYAVRAVGSGHAAANAIDQYLRGEEITPAQRPFNVTMGRIDEDTAARMVQEASAHPRISPSSGEDAGFNDEEAAREGLRCLHCDCRGFAQCRLRRFAEQYDASVRAFTGAKRAYELDATHPSVLYESGKCIACGLCVEIARQHEEELGLTFIGRGFDVRTRVPMGETLANGLREVAIECARACPTGALVVREEAQEVADDD